MWKKIVTAIIAISKWVWSVILDISTFLREGDKTSPFSSKRICGVFLLAAGVKLLFVGVSSFMAILSNGWYAVFVFLPSALCFVIAALFFYINGQIDIKTAVSEAKDVFKEIRESK